MTTDDRADPDITPRPQAEEPFRPPITLAEYFVCCGSGCAGCPEFWGEEGEAQR